MVYSTKQMYDIALAMSVENGPISIPVDGRTVMAYAMTKKGLRDAFVDHGYSPRRSTWMNCVEDWQDLYDVEISGELRNPQNWRCFVIFTLIGKSNMTTLQMAAEDIGLPCYPPAVTV